MEGSREEGGMDTHSFSHVSQIGGDDALMINSAFPMDENQDNFPLSHQ